MGKPARTRMSAAHERQDLRVRNPLYEKAGQITGLFEPERCPLNARQLADAGKSEVERRREARQRVNRRDSFMVKRQKPNPVLRPTPRLAMRSDQAAFNGQWSKEQHAAQRSQIRSLHTARRDLEKTRDDLDKLETRREEAAVSGTRGEFNAAQREFFKIQRRAQRIGNHVRKRTQQSR